MDKEFYDSISSQEKAYKDSMENSAYKISEAIDQAIYDGITVATTYCDIDEEFAKFLTKERNYDVTIFRKEGFRPITRVSFGKNSTGTFKETDNPKDVEIMDEIN